MAKHPANKHPLNRLADDAIDHTDALLFRGSLLGGQSLESLLALYKSDSPFTPTRHELIRHLSRCLNQLVEMDALIIARARTIPYKQLSRHLKRRAKKKESQNE